MCTELAEKVLHVHQPHSGWLTESLEYTLSVWVEAGFGEKPSLGQVEQSLM